jgi:hypothetical protein
MDRAPCCTRRKSPGPLVDTMSGCQNRRPKAWHRYPVRALNTNCAAGLQSFDLLVHRGPIDSVLEINQATEPTGPGFRLHLPDLATVIPSLRCKSASRRCASIRLSLTLL